MTKIEKAIYDKAYRKRQNIEERRKYQREWARKQDRGPINMKRRGNRTVELKNITGNIEKIS